MPRVTKNTVLLHKPSCFPFSEFPLRSHLWIASLLQCRRLAVITPLVLALLALHIHPRMNGMALSKSQHQPVHLKSANTYPFSSLLINDTTAIPLRPRHLTPLHMTQQFHSILLRR